MSRALPDSSTTYYAHSGTPGDKRDWQTMRDHALAVARGAADFAVPAGLEAAAYLAGIFHDLGKYDPAFPPRLEGANVRVDHSTAGAAVLLRLAQGAGRDMAELCAYAILGHHAGLLDKLSASPGCFKRRLEGFEDRLAPVWRGDIPFDLAGLAPPALFKRLSSDRAQRAFDLSVAVRMLFSALVDADFKDTERYYGSLEKRQPDRNWKPLRERLPGFLAAFDAKMAAMPVDGDLNLLRNAILGHVRAGAAQEPGLFTLTVPTGGGKTLASLGFALEHAARWGHRRIILSIPFTSIIDQTAAIFRDVLGAEHVLEHHSAIEEHEGAARKRRSQEKPPVSRDRLKLAMEDWAAPVVVTTNVQFFESLFAARTARARKVHNIAGSIIVLDEAQTVPRHVLKPCMRMLDTLARLFHCTIVLCTATQPALGKPAFKDGLDLAGRELAPQPEELARKLKRARIVRRPEPMDNAALVEAMEGEKQGSKATSPLARGRGSKLHIELVDAGLARVAPRAGARIETLSQAATRRQGCVAPRAGARIETRSALRSLPSARSPLARGRGSKQAGLAP